MRDRGGAAEILFAKMVDSFGDSGGVGVESETEI